MQAFFCRYLFKKALLEDDIAHEEAMEKKEKKEKAMTMDTVKWEQGMIFFENERSSKLDKKQL